MRVILKDFRTSRWISFENPAHRLVASCPADITPLLASLHEIVAQQRYYVAGYIAYEAATGFDQALTTKKTDSFPVICLGVFAEALNLSENSMEVPGQAYENTLTPSITEPEYFRSIKKIKQYLESGDTYQVNYTFRLQGDAPRDGFSLFQRLCHSQPGNYSAYIDTGQHEILSVSPELFLHKEGQDLFSKPMKGTIQRGLFLKEDDALAEKLKRSEKAQAENVMIVDMVRHDLGRIACNGSVRVSSLMDIEKYPTLWQMTSTIHCKTPVAWDRILSSAFPAASITGAPKKRTMEIIADLECSPRNIYTGAIGYIDPHGDGRFSVAIRSALVNKKMNTIEYGTGGGIVWDSHPEDEYEECLLKSKVLTGRRPDFDLLETIRMDRGSGCFLLDYHLERLSQSARYFDYPFDEHSIRKYIEAVSLQHPDGTWKLRLLLSRKGNLTHESIPVDPEVRGWCRVRFATDPVDSKDAFLYHKTTFRDVYQSARASVNDCDDVILWNERGEVTESSVANLMVEIHGSWWTPPVSSGLLAGTYRRHAIERGNLKERVLFREDVEKSSSLRLANSVRMEIPAILLAE